MKETKKISKFFFPIISLFFLLNILLPLNTSAQSEVDPSQTLPDSDLSATTSPTTSGQVISLDFSIPGIGTNGANLKPLRSTRSVTIYFFGIDVNSQDPSVKPRGSVKTQVQFDEDQTSPTYGNFINPNIHLNNTIPNGDYQIVFKTDQALAKLVKENDKALGGQKFRIQSTYGQLIKITNQEVIIGDIAPSGAGDNIMNISDYSAFVECFGEKANSSNCPEKTSADLDDNGVIDGVDYNILFKSFNTLLSLGLPVPTLSPSGVAAKPSQSEPPEQDVEKKATESASGKNDTKAGGVLGLLFTVVIILVLIAAIVLYIFNDRFKEFIKGIIKKLSFIPHSNQDDNAETKIAETQTTQVENPQESTIDKEYYIKKLSSDEKGTWLTLTDDNGPISGFFKGEVIEGFAKVKGIVRNENDKTFIEISEISPSNI